MDEGKGGGDGRGGEKKMREGGVEEYWDLPGNDNKETR